VSRRITLPDAGWRRSAAKSAEWLRFAAANVSSRNSTIDDDGAIIGLRSYRNDLLAKVKVRTVTGFVAVRVVLFQIIRAG
jgi:hypothetical protein